MKGEYVEGVLEPVSDELDLENLAVEGELPAGLRGSYLQTLAASYFVQLIELVVEKDTPIPEIHGLLKRALDHVAKEKPAVRAVTYFEQELVEHLGIGQPLLPPHGAIRSLHSRLPPQREELMTVLGVGD